MKPKIYLLLALFCLLLWSFQPAMIHAQEQLAYVQWSPFPDIISAKTSDDIVLFSPELKEIDRWLVTDETTNESILYYAWSPDGSKLAVMLADPFSSFAGTSLTIWDVATRQYIAKVTDIFPMVLEWSYNSQYIIIDSSTKTRPYQAEVWFINAKNGVVQYRWKIVTDSIASHPTTLQFATISKGVQLWDISSFPPQEIAQLPMAHDGIEYNATGSQIAFREVGQTYNEVSIYDTQTLERVQILTTGDTSLNGVMTSLDWGDFPLTTSFGYGNLGIWHPDTGDMIWQISDFSVQPGELGYLPSWNPDGTMFVLNDAEIGIHIRDGRTGAILARMDEALPEMP